MNKRMNESMMLAEGVLGTTERTIILDSGCDLLDAITIGIAQARLDTNTAFGSKKIETTVLFTYNNHTIGVVATDRAEKEYARWSHILHQ
jgi:hypothetical protein